MAQSLLDNLNHIEGFLAVALHLYDGIQDILIHLGTQYHLISTLNSNEHLFLDLVLQHSNADLAMSLHGLKGLERELDFS